MKAKLTPDDPGSFTYTLHISYTLAQWGLICAKLTEASGGWAYPMCDLIDAIRDATSKAQKTFEPTPRP